MGTLSGNGVECYEEQSKAAFSNSAVAAVSATSAAAVCFMAVVIWWVVMKRKKSSAASVNVGDKWICYNEAFKPTLPIYTDPSILQQTLTLISGNSAHYSTIEKNLNTVS
jgi:hypothetical protein